MLGDSNMETYNTICKIDSQWEFADSGNSNRGSVTIQSRMGREMVGRFKRKGTYVYLWLILVDV